MKLAILALVFLFGSLNAQVVDSNDPNLRIGMDSSFEGDVADVTGIHQNAQRSYAVVPSATCPECAHFPNLVVDAPSELNGAPPTGNPPGSENSDDSNQR